MKKTALLILCSIMLAAGSAAHARPGFTAGIYSGLATEGGPFVQTLSDKSAGADIAASQYVQNAGVTQPSFELNQSKRSIPDISVSAQYEFRSGFFLRSGVDFAVLASGKDISYRLTSPVSTTWTSYKFSYSTQGIIVPLYAGFSLYPGRSPVGAYGAVGVAGGTCRIERSERIEKSQFSAITNTRWKTKSASAPIIGLTALIGIEANIWKRVSLTLEYVFNDISDAKTEKGYIEKSETPIYPQYKYTEHFGFPSQLVRFGARFAL